eukprot:tig00020563_g11249.t1
MDSDGAWNRFGLLFLLPAFVAINSLTTIETLLVDRPLLAQERADGMYHVLPYAAARTLADFAFLRRLIELDADFAFLRAPPVAALVACVYALAGLRPELFAFLAALLYMQCALNIRPLKTDQDA